MCDDVLFAKGAIQRPSVCPGCADKIKPVSQPSCMKCGKQLDEDEREYCNDCSVKKHNFDRGAAAFSYSDSMKKSMYAFKYNNRREYAGFYADTLLSGWETLIRAWKPQIIIPVPLHKTKYRKRGYNQAEVFARALSERLDVPVDASYLMRVRKTRPQKELNDRERCNNINNAFQTAGNGVKYRQVLLTDDIYTTGATVDECARVLKAAGAQEVYFAAVCIGRGF